MKNETTMKACLAKEYGSFEVLEFEEVKKPTPKPQEILVKVYATTVNRTDHAILNAIPRVIGRCFSGLIRPRNPILGCEFAGEVVELGSDVTRFQLGDRVFGFNPDGFGAHAEYMLKEAEGPMALIPEGITYEQAAASSEGAFYAYNSVNNVKLGPGVRVLVNGATGGIGSAAVQWLRHFGVETTAVCEGKHESVLKDLGADRVVDYTTEDFTEENRTYHLVFDAVGKSSFGACKRLLEPKGVYISSDLGAWGQNIFFGLFTMYSRGKKVGFPFPVNCREIILQIKILLEAGEFKPLIDRVYSFEEMVSAYEYVGKGQKIGNVVIRVDKEPVA